MNTQTKRIIITLAAVLLAFVAVLYFNPDSISLTAPLWDYCGLHQTHKGTALDCIKFDVDVVRIK